MSAPESHTSFPPVRWRLSLRKQFTEADTLEAGDVLATGRPGDEALLASLAIAGGHRLKLVGCAKFPRACAEAASPCHFFYVPLSELAATLGALPEVLSAPDGIRATLQRYTLFEDVPPAELDRISYVFTPAVHTDGTR